MRMIILLQNIHVTDTSLGNYMTLLLIKSVQFWVRNTISLHYSQSINVYNINIVTIIYILIYVWYFKIIYKWFGIDHVLQGF